METKEETLEDKLINGLVACSYHLKRMEKLLSQMERTVKEVLADDGKS